MRAVLCKQTELSVVEVAAPTPGKGHLLIDVTRCGICGSDLHARHHAEQLLESVKTVGVEHLWDPAEGVVFGHEFSGVVAGRGPGTSGKIKDGTPVVALPMLKAAGEVQLTGYSSAANGAYAEQVLVQEAMTFSIPNGLATETAALTEPLAVALHAVNRGQISNGQVAIVIGCGPIGLATILMLKARGVKQVIASDFSAARRDLAAACGADLVVDPKVESPFANQERFGHAVDAMKMYDQGLKGFVALRRLPVPWEPVFRLAERLGQTQPKFPVIFECVGVPGVIDQIIAGASINSRVVVVGVCMDDDTFRPAIASNKEIDLRFVFAYTPLEFRDTLHMLAEGKVDPTPLITGTVGLEGVDDAFAALGATDKHAKILIDPRKLGSAGL